MKTYTSTFANGKTVTKQVPDDWSADQVRAAFAHDYKQRGTDSLKAQVLNDPRIGLAQYYNGRDQGTISATPSTLGTTLQNALAGVMSGAGVDERYAGHVADRAMRAFNDLTPVGSLTGANEAGSTFKQGLSRGDLGTMAAGLGAFGLSVLPYGSELRAVKGPAKDILGKLFRDESGAIRAWHGSPHDFDKFSMDKIGTGEGAQAYGQGLYFAENKGVAEDYRRTLSKRPSSISDPQDDVANYWIRAANGDRKKAAALLLDYTGGDADAQRTAQHILNPPGRLYEVNIDAEPHDFLNWDAPNSADPRLAKLGLQPKPWRGNPNGPPPDLFYRGLTENPETFEKLKGGGIPGIRYLDQGSRGVGGGTSNYVVFDPSLVSILNKL